MALYAVTVKDQPKGEVLRIASRWRWLRPNGSCEVYRRPARLLEVREHIARVCLAKIGDVKLVAEKDV